MRSQVDTQSGAKKGPRCRYNSLSSVQAADIALSQWCECRIQCTGKQSVCTHLWTVIHVENSISVPLFPQQGQGKHLDLLWLSLNPNASDPNSLAAFHPSKQLLCFQGHSKTSLGAEEWHCSAVLWRVPLHLTA